MRERGFMPFSAAGALIVLLVLGMVAHAAWSRHWRSLRAIDDISDSALLTAAAGVQGDLKAALKYAVYQALWDVSKRAVYYENDSAREDAIERLATSCFAERLSEIGPAYSLHDMRVELDLPDSSTCPSVDIEEVGEGYALVRGRLPEGTGLRLASRDGSLSLVLPLENIETFVDSRYFLLQERMGEFVGRRGDICTWWGIMEYLAAWGGAWLDGRVELSESRTKAFFETAWAVHEFNTFGSSDYWAAAGGLMGAIGGGADDLVSELNNRAVFVTPISTADVESMSGYIDSAIEAAEGASSLLNDAKEQIRSARNAAAGHENDTGMLDNVREMLANASAGVAEARGNISEAGEQFHLLLEFISGSASGNVVMATLQQSLTSRTISEGYPSLEEQVGWCVDGVSARLLELERSINDAMARLSSERLEITLEDILDLAESSIESMFSEPAPIRWVTFATYSEDPPRSVEERAPVYIDDDDGGTIGLLKLVLEGARGNLGDMKNLSQRFEPAPEDIQGFEIDEGLSSRLGSSPPEFSIDREQFYELLPPAPIQSSPGLSVFHEFDVKKVSNLRWDLAGMCGSPTATPIPLWFIGVTLWWGQWKTTVELEPGAVEEVLDFDNPTLPMAHGSGYFHKPLAYRWEMEDGPFEIDVVVVSLRPFIISQG